MFYWVALFLALNLTIYAETPQYDSVCIGGEACKCICTYEPNPQLQALIKKGIARRICGCPKGGCGTKKLENIPEFKMKKEDIKVKESSLVP